MAQSLNFIGRVTTTRNHDDYCVRIDIFCFSDYVEAKSWHHGNLLRVVTITRYQQTSALVLFERVQKQYGAMGTFKNTFCHTAQ